jgi:hypothetical protein
MPGSPAPISKFCSIVNRLTVGVLCLPDAGGLGRLIPYVPRHPCDYKELRGVPFCSVQHECNAVALWQFRAAAVQEQHSVSNGTQT